MEDNEEASREKTEDEKKVSYQPLLYPEHGNGLPIQNDGTINDYHGYIAAKTSATHIEDFLANARVADAETCGRHLSNEREQASRCFAVPFHGLFVHVVVLEPNGRHLESQIHCRVVSDFGGVGRGRQWRSANGEW